MKLNSFLVLSALSCLPLAAHAAPAPAGPGLTLTSRDFPDGGIIPNKFTQSDPHPVSPELEWTHVPAGTASFALIVHDLDTAPMKSNQDSLHWMMFNIPATATQLARHIPAVPKLPDGSVQGTNRGTLGYRGMGAGPAGPYHHYTFELFALDTMLELGPDATRQDLWKAIDGHILGIGVMVGRFHR